MIVTETIFCADFSQMEIPRAYIYIAPCGKDRVPQCKNSSALQVVHKGLSPVNLVVMSLVLGFPKGGGRVSVLTLKVDNNGMP